MIDSVLSIFEPEVILLDIMLWKKSWLDICREINTYYSEIKSNTPRIIVFSNLDNDNIKLEFKSLWVNEYLLKMNNEPQDLVNYLQEK